MYDFYGIFPPLYSMGILTVGVIGILFMVVLAVKLALFLLRAFGFYQLARRRGIHNPWLSWFPLGRDWIRGSLSDQYQYLTMGKNSNRRMVLLLAALASGVVQTTVLGISFLNLSNSLAGAHGMHHMLRLGSLAGLWGFLSLVVGAIRLVYHHLSMYDVYRSCDSGCNVVMLVLGIFIPILEPFFVFFSRNKDEGMPPRRDRPNGTAQQPYGSQTDPVDARYESPRDPEQV